MGSTGDMRTSALRCQSFAARFGATAIALVAMAIPAHASATASGERDPVSGRPEVSGKAVAGTCRNEGDVTEPPDRNLSVKHPGDPLDRTTQLALAGTGAMRNIGEVE